MVGDKRTLDDFEAMLEALAGSAPTERPEVLVIDDDGGVRSALQQYLSQSYDVTTCANGDEGVMKLRPESHAVILDIKMKGKDGFETFADLRRRSEDVPIVFYSAYQNIKDPIEILNSYRPFGYVIKDGNPQTLSAMVASAVAHYQQILDNKKLLTELQELNANLEQRVQQRTRELELAMSQLKYLTETDPLTGLANRRHFFSVYEGLLTQDPAPFDALTLLLVDVDHFKRINDRYGHPAGDSVLKTVAAALKGSVRADDLVARVGGEEFAILAPGLCTEDAIPYGERLRQAVAGRDIVCDSDTPVIHATISIGFCAVEGITPEAERLYKLADRALYMAKGSGRNNVAYLPYGLLSEGYPPSVRG